MITKHGKHMNKEERKKAILDEIAKKEAELLILETGERTAVIKLEDYTTEEKVAFFDKIYNDSLFVLERVEEEGHDRQDPQYAYENCMSILNIRDIKAFWKYFNSICG